MSKIAFISKDIPLDIFTHNGYEIQKYEAKEESIDKIVLYSPTVIILELLSSGAKDITIFFYLANSLKECLPTTPIIFVLDKNETLLKRVVNIENSDFVLNQYTKLELLYRVEKYNKRCVIEKIDNNLYFNHKTNELKKGDKIIYLTPQLAKLLKLFLNHKNTILSHDQIEYAIWNESVLDSTRNALVSKLRKILDGKFIETVHKYGYKFKI